MGCDDQKPYSYRRVDPRTRRKIQPPIFSGDDGQKMWEQIYEAKTVKEIQAALITVVIKLQHFENRILLSRKESNEE